MREMTAEQRALVRQLREILPDPDSLAAIEEAVCGREITFLNALNRARSLADFQELWHHAPEGTFASVLAFRRWDDRAGQELLTIRGTRSDDDEATREEAYQQLKDAYYNAPPGGDTRRLVLDRLVRGVRRR